MYAYILAIDPGSTHSGVCLMNSSNYRPLKHGKIPNESFFELEVGDGVPGRVLVVIEETQNYGMPAGRDLRDTIRWSGRLQQHFVSHGFTVEYVPRTTVKLVLCNTPKAKDGNVVQALVDRFAPGQANKGKGTKGNPGWFHGFANDAWQAYALGVAAIDLRKEPERKA